MGNERCVFFLCVVFSDCVALQSPYCAWHKRESKCVTIPLDRPISRRDYIQNVSTGNHSDCPKLTNSVTSNSIPSEQHKSTSKSIDSSGSQTINILSDNGQSNKEVNDWSPIGELRKWRKISSFLFFNVPTVMML